MGCTSSTEYVVDPATGKEVKKTKFGGAHPANRRPQQAPYTPPATDFGKDGQATAHFVAYGGGNALTLVQKDGTSTPQTGPKPPEYIEVTIPEGVTAGQTIHVQNPDGELNAVVVPSGFGPGDTFIVEFAPTGEEPPPTKMNASAPPEASATAVEDPEVYVPTFSTSNNNNDVGNYPSASATPVYRADSKY
eukprot:CAMPEP_0172454852 /NCGR_PEP_ID=MMETSP1065-20121228/11725_1 /TAXON_ID=265537 /ORGANISM="Amphiprora paludosa, Strain CCMP125" /LENGTH=190 /DNA_ID=CAMNT_0013207257 /DNA_START=17 /DNA_END=589 /DNA_ORIENTATION=-